jgi:hypothetical protein
VTLKVVHAIGHPTPYVYGQKLFHQAQEEKKRKEESKTQIKVFDIHLPEASSGSSRDN